MRPPRVSAAVSLRLVALASLAIISAAGASRAADRCPDIAQAVEALHEGDEYQATSLLFAAARFGCEALWHVVRIKCLACGSTEGVRYQEIDGGPGLIKAETCDGCRSYVKLLRQDKDPNLDPEADDVASLGLDLLLRDSPYRRAGYNPFLLGY
jgi:formate dehydrogenase accessory protein FdhE